MPKLPRSFYTRRDVVIIAKELLGKYLMTKINGSTAGGIITETEAYAGVTDKASHAYGGLRSKRTGIMYGNGGFAYVYLCYGMYHLFNVITNVTDIPHAVLIRAIEPTHRIDLMLRRRKKIAVGNNFIGPGKLSQGLAITTELTGTDLTENKIWIEDRGTKISKHEILAGPRINVSYAGKDAKLPYRFRIMIK
ncbi:MAG: DNA-3-methyladenine glycosylase [Bacteroidetes bacterium]|nr:DNA-3-methyladenine glycosylase [Bacteroidota bacterium]